jgi:hypothetical protein
MTSLKFTREDARRVKSEQDARRITQELSWESAHLQWLDKENDIRLKQEKQYELKLATALREAGWDWTQPDAGLLYKEIRESFCEWKHEQEEAYLARLEVWSTQQMKIRAATENQWFAEDEAFKTTMYVLELGAAYPLAKSQVGKVQTFVHDHRGAEDLDRRGAEDLDHRGAEDLDHRGAEEVFDLSQEEKEWLAAEQRRLRTEKDDKTFQIKILESELDSASYEYAVGLEEYDRNPTSEARECIDRAEKKCQELSDMLVGLRL